MRQLVIVGLIAAAFSASAMSASKPAKTPSDAKPATKQDAQPVPIQTHLRDISIRFVDFYDRASKPAPVPPAPPAAPAAPAADGKQAAVAPVAPPAPVESEQDRRWRFFKQAYGFSAQPDDAATRVALEAAWPRYEAVMPQIRAGYDSIAPEWSSITTGVVSRLALAGSKPFEFRVVSYVGTFEGKVWTAQEGDLLNVYLPLEVSPDARMLPLARIIARLALQREAAWGAQPRNLTELAINEGIYAHVLKDVVPGKTTAEYLDMTPEQFTKVSASAKTDLKAMQPKLRDGSPATLAQYSAQMDQVRYAGWLLVDQMTKANVRYVDLMHQKQADLMGVAVKSAGVIARAK
ncbi:MAG: hypothetical protein JO142_17720 [Burkholderiales bacterium]|nr:hypothetical protein [Burkholderiales bacterium]